MCSVKRAKCSRSALRARGCLLRKASVSEARRRFDSSSAGSCVCVGGEAGEARVRERPSRRARGRLSRVARRRKGWEGTFGQ